MKTNKLIRSLVGLCTLSFAFLIAGVVFPAADGTDQNTPAYIDDSWARAGYTYDSSRVEITTQNDRRVVTLKADTVPITDPGAAPGGFNDIAQSSQNVVFTPENTPGNSVTLDPTATNPFIKTLGQWASMPKIPKPGDTTRYIFVPHDGKKYLYCLFVKGDGKSFARLDATANELSRKWEFLEPMPKPAGDGAAIAYDGNYIYALRGGGAKEFYRYSMPSAVNPLGKWYRMADVDNNIMRSACIVNVGGPLYDGSGHPAGGVMYITNYSTLEKFVPEDSGPTLAINNTDSGQWGSPDTIPGGTGGGIDGRSLAYPGGGYLYVSYPNSFYKYRISDGQWTSIGSLPTYDAGLPSMTPTNTAISCAYSSFTYPGRGKYIYLRAYSKFLRLDIMSDTWEALNDMPLDIGLIPSITYFTDISLLPSQRPAGAAIADSSTGTLSFLSGINYTGAWMFNIPSAPDALNPLRWNDLASGDNVKQEYYGSVSYYPGYDAAHPVSENYIYHVGSHSDSIYRGYWEWFSRYDIVNNRWERLKDFPAQNYASGRHMTYLNGYIYCAPTMAVVDPARGNRYVYRMYRYKIDKANLSEMPPREGDWEELEPFDLQSTTLQADQWGLSIIGQNIGGHDYIYLVAPGKNFWFWRYDACHPATAPDTAWASCANYGKPTTGTVCNSDLARLDPENVAMTCSRGTYVYNFTYDYWYTMNSYSGGYNHNAAMGSLQYWQPLIGASSLYELYGSSECQGSMSRFGNAALGGSIVSEQINGTPQSIFKYTTTWTELEPMDSVNFMPMAATVLPSSDPARVANKYNGIYLWAVYGNHKMQRFDPLRTDPYTGDMGAWTELLVDTEHERTWSYTDGQIFTDGNENIYLWFGDTHYESRPNSHIWVYSTKENRWTGLMHAPFHLFGGSRGIYAPEVDSIYGIKGHYSNRVYKYKLSGAGSGTWSAVTASGAPRFLTGAQLVLGPTINNGAIRQLYAMTGNYAGYVSTSRMAILKVPTSGAAESWQSPSEMQFTFAYPYWTYNTLTSDRNGVMYAYERASAQVWKYDADLTSWTQVSRVTLDGIEMLCGDGAILFAHSYKVGETWNDYLYCAPYYGTDTFLRYSLNSPAGWERVSGIPFTISPGSTCATSTSTNPWIYLYNPGVLGAMFKYYPGRPDLNAADKGMWNDMPFLPTSIDHKVAYCGYKGYVYMLQTNQFFRYNSTTNAWEALPQAPGSGIEYWNGRMLAAETPTGTYIYVIPGQGSNRLYRYSIADGVWTIYPTPGSLGWGWGAGLAVNGSYLYALQGGSGTVWRWNLNTNAGFDDPINVPPSLREIGASLGRGGSIAAADNCLWVVFGGGNATLSKYDFKVGTPSWQASGRLPVTIRDAESVMSYPGFGDYIFLAQGGAYSGGTSSPSNVFMRFSLTTKKWDEVRTEPTVKAATYPDVASLKAALVALAGSDTGLVNSINTASGATTQEFVDNLLNNISPANARLLGLVEWYPSLPNGMSAGGTLVYAGGNYFYTMPGNGQTVNVGKFMPFAVGELISQPREVGVHNSWGAMSWTGSGLTGVKVSARTGSKKDMTDAPDWSSVPDVQINTVPALGTSVKPSDKFFQYKVSLFTSDPQVKPTLSSLTMSYTKYPDISEIISPPFETSDKNRIWDIKWDLVVPQTETQAERAGKGVRFQLKAAPTQSALASTWWKGDQGTASFTNDFSIAADYMSDRDVKVDTQSRQVVLDASKIYKQAIQINNTAAGSELLTDYQVKVTLDSSSDQFWSTIREDGSDIRFAEDLGSGNYKKLSFWVQKLDFNKKSAIIWVKIPSVPQDSTKTNIYIMYGIKSASSESSFNNTMVTSYSKFNDPSLVGEWNFGNLTRVATTYYAYNQVPGGSTGTVSGARWQLVPGRFGGKAFWCNRSGQIKFWTDSKYEVANSGTQKMTYEFTAKHNQPTIDSWLFDRGVNRVGGWKMYSHPSGNGSHIYTVASGSGVDDLWMGGVYPKYDTWQHMAYVIDVSVPSNFTAKYYVEGDPYLTRTNAYEYTGMANSWMYFGGNSNVTIESLRVYNRELPAAEIKAHYECRKYAAVDPAVTLSPAVIPETAFSDWQYFQPVIISSNFTTETTGRSDQTAVITIDGSSIHDFFWASGPNADEIRISDGYPVPYQHKVLCFDKVNKKASIYVKIPYLSNTKPITAYIYFGNPSAANTESPLSSFVPTSGLKAMYGFDQQGATVNDISDLSGNGNNARLISSTPSSMWNYTTAKAGKSIELSPNNYIDLQKDTNAIGMAGSFTAIAWIRPTALGTSNGAKNPVFAIENSTPSMNLGITYSSALGFVNRLYAEYNNQSITGAYNNIYSDGNWYHVAYRYTSGINKMEILLNGITAGNPENYGTVGSPVLSLPNSVNIGKLGSSYFTGQIDEMFIYNRALSDTEVNAIRDIPGAAATNYLACQPNTALGYSPYNPAVQPVMGVFYDSRPDTSQGNKIPFKITSFTTSSASVPGSTGIRYQISYDGWHWYWYVNTPGPNYHTWQRVELGYDEANEAPEIDLAALNAFQADYTTGDFIWRAYMHSADGTATPTLSWVKVQAESQLESYYLNPAGNAINPLYRDVMDNRWFQYKATLYSDGQNAPVLDKVTINYINPTIRVTYPNATTEFQANRAYNITWTSTGLKTKPVDNGKVTLKYTLDGSNYVLMPGGGAVDAEAFTFSFTTPDAHTDKFKVKIISNEFGEGATGIYDESDANSYIYDFKLTWPTLPGQRFEQSIQYTITWSKFGTVTDPVKLTLLKNGNPVAGLPEPAIGVSSGATQAYNWVIPKDDRYLGTGWQVKLEDSAATEPKISISKENFEIAPAGSIKLSDPQGRNISPINPLITEMVVGNTYDVLWDTTGIVLPGDMTYKYYVSPTSDWTDPPYLTNPPIPGDMVDDPAYWSLVTPVAGSLSVSPTGGSLRWEVPDVIDYSSGNCNPKAVILKTGENFKRPNYTEPVADRAQLRILPPSITITDPVYIGPAERPVWVAGDKGRTINWTKEGMLLYPLKVQYSKDYKDYIGQPNDATWVDIATIAKPGLGDTLTYIWSNAGAGIPIEAAGGWSDPVYIRVVDAAPSRTAAGPQYPLASTPVDVTILGYHELKIVTPTKELVNGENIFVEWKWYGEATNAAGHPIVNDLVMELSTDGGNTWPPEPATKSNTRLTGLTNVIDGTSLFGTYWNVPEVESSQCVIRIFGDKEPPLTGASRVSDMSNVFTIKVPTLAMTGPDIGAGKILYKNGLYDITWSAAGDIGTLGLTVEYRVSPDGTNWPATWHEISSTIPSGTTSITFRMPRMVDTADTRNKKIQIRVQSNKWKEGAQPGESRVQTEPLEATIVEPSVVAIVSPSSANVSGNSWVLGNPYNIAWTISPGALQKDAIKKFNIYYTSDCTVGTPTWLPVTPDSVIMANDPRIIIPDNKGSVEWTILPTVVASTKAAIRIEVYYDNTSANTMLFKSDQFTLAPPSLTINSFASNDYRIGQACPVKWYPAGINAIVFPIKILYSYDGTTWNSSNTTDPTTAGVAKQYNAKAELDPLWVTEGPDTICITNWAIPDHATPEVPHKVWVKVIDSGVTDSSINPTTGQPNPAGIRSFNLLVPSIEPVTPSSLNSVTEKINMQWNVIGALRGPVSVRWTRVDRTASGDIGTIAVPDVNSKHDIDWEVPDNAGGLINVIVEDLGWKKQGDAQSKVINQTDNFVILYKPEFNIILPSVQDNTWRIGETYQVNWAKTNNGNTSNSFKIDMWEGDDGSGTSICNIISATPSGPWRYSWYIDPQLVTKAYRDLRVRIEDNGIWNSGAIPAKREHSVFFSSSATLISIDIPAITLTYPKTENYWAMQDRPRIVWTTDGYSSPSGITIELVLDPQGMYGSPDIRQLTSTASNTTPTSKTGYYDYVVDKAGGSKIIIPGDYIEAKLIVTDAQEYDDADNPGDKLKVKDESAIFRIIAEPTIANVAVSKANPIPGDPEPFVFVLGEGMKINWQGQGKAIQNVRITYFKASDPGNEEVVAERAPNTGEYVWPNMEANRLVGRDIIMKVVGYGDIYNTAGDVIETDVPIGVAGNTPAQFRIRGNLRVISPVENDKVLALYVPPSNTYNIKWETIGNLPKVQLEYSINGGAWQIINSGAATNVTNVLGENKFAWSVPDIPSVLKDTNGNFIQPAPTPIKIRVRDMGDLDETIGESKTFYIDYARIKWNIYDIDTYAKLTGFTVKEYVSGLPDPVSTESNLGPDFTRYYPYQALTTEFSNDDYITGSKTWTPSGPSAKEMVIYLQNRLLVNVEWHVLVNPVYTVEYVEDQPVDKLTVTSWLEKKGKVVGMIQDERDQFHGATIEIYDSQGTTPILTSENLSVDEKGTFWFEWDNPGLAPGKNYFAKTYIRYGQLMRDPQTNEESYPTYVSGAAFDVTQARQQVELSRQLTAATETITTAIITGTTEIKNELTETVIPAISAVKAETAQIKGETAQILVSTSETLPSQITAAETKVTTMLRSQILTRQNSVRGGQDLMIQYRTPASDASIEIYDPNNMRVFGKQQMLPLATVEKTGESNVYQYLVSFDGGWGMGDFTVICSDSNGNMDALMISVQSSTIEDVASNVAAILGNTASLQDFKDTAENLNSQFSVIEAVLTKIGKEMGVGKGGVGSMMDSVAAQLTALAKQVKQVSSKNGVSLDKLYQVSMDKRGDLKYLKNKTQELKAAMDINKQMVDNIANKTVTQTWYEYK